MGDISYERLLFIRSFSPGTFVENRSDCSQIGHIDYARRDAIDEVRIIHLNNWYY